jgi:exonuclease VII large subunit
MDRRAVVGRLAATLAALPFGEVPILQAATSFTGEPFEVTPGNLAESLGMVTCPKCQEMWDSLDLTPAGVCLSCADRNPAMKAPPHSDPFWTLSVREVRRIEREIQRLATKLERMNRRFAVLQQQGSEAYERAMEGRRDEWQALQRELHLLQLLRAASKQFAAVSPTR